MATAFLCKPWKTNNSFHCLRLFSMMLQSTGIKVSLTVHNARSQRGHNIQLSSCIQVYCSFHQTSSKHGTAHPCSTQNIWVLFNTTLNGKCSYRKEKEKFPVFRCNLLQSSCCKAVSILTKPKHSTQVAGVLIHDFGFLILLFLSFFSGKKKEFHTLSSLIVVRYQVLWYWSHP